MLPFFPSDIARYLAAIILYWLVVLPPGFVLAYSADILGFRSRTRLFRLYTATTAGLSVPPILMYLCWSLGSLRCVWALYAVFWLAFVVLLSARRVHIKDLCPLLTESLLAAGWIALAGVILLDLRIGSGLYINWASVDHSFRTTLIQAIHYTNVLPAANPFFYPGHAVPFRYHYFWFMMAAFVQVISGGLINARDALFASIAWAGLAVTAVVSLFIHGQGETDLYRWRIRTWIAAGLMSITGLDLLPDGLLTLVVSAPKHRFFIPFGDFEFWNGDGQVTSWLGSLVWVPNHVGGLVCGCSGVLFLLWAYRCSELRQRVLACMLAGLAFASSAGCSIYVVFVFVIALAALFLGSILGRHWRLTALLVLSGVTAAFAALPYLRELSAATGGVPFAVLRPRTFGPVLWFMHGTPSTLDIRGVVAMLLCLPLNFALELGFFAAIGIYKFRKMRTKDLDLGGWVLLALLVSGMIIGSFLASVALPHNDLGWRAMLVPQFVLLLWAVEWFEEASFPSFSFASLFRGAGKPIIVLGLIGVAGTVYDAALLRFYAVAIDHNRGTSANVELSSGLGARTAELRTIYTRALNGLPASNLVQENPLVADAIQQGLYSSWGSAARGREYGPYYGGSHEDYARTEDTLRPVFEQPVPLSYVEKICTSSRIGAFVVQESDPVWRAPNSWMSSVQPVYSGEQTQAFMCTEILRSAAVVPGAAPNQPTAK